MEENKEYRPTLALNEKGVPAALDLAAAIYHVLDRHKADNITVEFVGDQINLTDYFVICSAKSNTHVRALADEVDYRLGLAGVKVDNREGKGDGNSWIVLDYINVMVHIFTPEARQQYNLEKLYPDAKKVEIGPDPDEVPAEQA